MNKRNDYIGWDEYFMGVAILSSKRSKDPNTQVGAVLVNENKRIIGIGYNGFPNGISDDEFPWSRTAEHEYDTKYPYVIHAETNAILNAMTSVKDAICYVTLFPCSDCMKILVQSKIKKIIYKDNTYKGTDSQIASEKLANAANIKLVQYDENISKNKN